MDDLPLDIHRSGAATILTLRGQRVILDLDLARMYGVPTGRLNEQFKRNRERFPLDFAFQLTMVEREKVVANCDNLQKIKYSPANPWAFTEHGVLMAASVLNSPSAIQMSIYLVRTFVDLRREVGSYHSLAARLSEVECKYDAKFKAVFDAIRELMKPPDAQPRKIGFRSAGEEGGAPRGSLRRRRDQP